MSTHPTRFGLIGAGAIAQSYVQAFATSDRVQLVAVADVRADAAGAIAQSQRCTPYSCYRTLAEQADVEAVVVCTPPSTHPDICTYFLERGIAVLCEKPLAIDVPQAEWMLQVAAAAGVQFTMASKFRYVADVIQAKSLVESGTLGQIVLFENSFASHVDMSRRWNSQPAISGGGVLIDNGTHSVDIMRYLFGPLADLQVVEGKRIQSLDVEDTVRMFVQTTSGVLGSIDLSWSIKKELPYYISLYGSAGTLHLGWKESKYRRASDDEWTVFGKGYDKVQAFRGQLENFAQALRGEAPLLITPADALASVQVIESAYISLKRADRQTLQPRPAAVFV